MSIGIYDDRRLRLLKVLPENWIDKIEKEFSGEIPSIFPDEAVVYNGPDKDCIEVLKKYGLYSKDVELLMSNKTEG